MKASLPTITTLVFLGCTIAALAAGSGAGVVGALGTLALVSMVVATLGQRLVGPLKAGPAGIEANLLPHIVDDVARSRADIEQGHVRELPQVLDELSLPEERSQ